MKITSILIIGVVSAAALLAQGESPKSQGHKTSARKSKTPVTARPVTAPRRVVMPIRPPATPNSVAPLEIPKDAKQLDATHFRVVDAQGAAWLYTKTPFGIMRGREDAAAQAAPEPPGARKETATVEGDHVRFELTTPFGKNVWTKKMSELTPEDRKLLKTSTPAPSATPGAAARKD